MLSRQSDSTIAYQVSQSAWHAVYTRHQHERTVAQILTSKGFEILLPLYKTFRRWKDRTKVLSSPLFPSYVFIKSGLESRLDILKTPGLHSIVSCAGQPSTIPASEIEALRRAVDSGAHLEPHPFLKCGDWVRVKSGLMAGVEGILVRKKSMCCLILSVEMLGKAASMEIDGCLVERTNSNPPFADNV